MDRNQKLDLIQRSLGIRHKLRVHETMKAPDSHEEMAAILLARWELEDELHAIEAILNDARARNTTSKRQTILKEHPYEGLSQKKKITKGSKE